MQITPEVLEAIDSDRFVILSSLPGVTISSNLATSGNEANYCQMDKVYLLIHGSKIIPWQVCPCLFAYSDAALTPIFAACENIFHLSI